MRPLPNFIERSYSTLLLVGIALGVCLGGKVWMQWTLYGLFILSMMEWHSLMLRVQIRRWSIKFWGLYIGGLGYILLGFWGIQCLLFAMPVLWVQILGEGICKSSTFLILLWSVVAMTDVAAYIVGSGCGKHLLYPKISPKKTWEGSIAALITSVLFGNLLMYFVGGKVPAIQSIGFFLVIGLLAQAGDLLESWGKRKLSIKDTGNLFPGHGGVLDRLDSMLAVGIFTLLSYLYGG